MTFLKTFLISVPVFFAIDMLWLGVIARSLYVKYLGYIMAEQTKWGSAVIFYLLFVAGVVYFATWPALQEGSLIKAIINGALIGFLAYMTYELTNHAVIADWPWQIVIIDILWGTFLGAFVSGFGYYISTILK
jgi:uncharacterized membrane protein